MKDVAQPVRVALTGRSASPPLFDVMTVLGREQEPEPLGPGSRNRAGRLRPMLALPVRHFVGPVHLPTTHLAPLSWFDSFLGYPPIKALLPIPIIAAIAPVIWWFFRRDLARARRRGGSGAERGRARLSQARRVPGDRRRGAHAAGVLRRAQLLRHLVPTLAGRARGARASALAAGEIRRVLQLLLVGARARHRLRADPLPALEAAFPEGQLARHGPARPRLLQARLDLRAVPGRRHPGHAARLEAARFRQLLPVLQARLAQLVRFRDVGGDLLAAVLLRSSCSSAVGSWARCGNRWGPAPSS